MHSSQLSEDKFIQILSLLIGDPKFRNDFFDNPEATLKEKGILLSEPELISLKKNNFSVNMNVTKNFKDGLVLCSSSGY